MGGALEVYGVSRFVCVCACVCARVRVCVCVCVCVSTSLYLLLEIVINNNFNEHGLITINCYERHNSKQDIVRTWMIHTHN